MSILDSIWGRVQGRIQNDPRFSEQFRSQIAGAQNPFGMRGSGGFLGQLKPFFQNLGPLAQMMSGLQGGPMTGGRAPNMNMVPMQPPQQTGPMFGGALANMGGVMPKFAPLDLNAEYERIKAEQGAGAAREWMAQQR